MFQRLGGAGIRRFRPRGGHQTTLAGTGLHDILHGRQTCPEFDSLHQGVGQIRHREGLFSCHPLTERGQICNFPALPPQSLNDSKADRGQRPAFPSKTSRFEPLSRAQGFSTPLARRRSSCPPPSPNLVRTHPIERYQALRDSAPCLSRATTSRRAPNWSSEEARTWEHHPQETIPPPRLNRQAEVRRPPVCMVTHIARV